MQQRDPNPLEERVSFTVTPLAALAVTTTIAITTPDRTFRIDRVEVLVDAGYAADPTNYYTLALAHGAGPTTAASWSTLTGAQGAITAGTPAAMVLSATDANRVAPAGATLKLVATKVAAGANILPRIVVHGRYVA